MRIHGEIIKLKTEGGLEIQNTFVEELLEPCVVSLGKEEFAELVNF
jgi:hypothetical protein